MGPHAVAAGLWGISGLAVAAGLGVAPALPGGSAPACAAAPPEARTVAPASLPGDTALSWLKVETLPPGLSVLVDGEPVGRSPLDSIPLPAGTVHVRVLRDDVRRFDRERDETTVSLRPGRGASAFFDLRPPIALESAPQGAEVSALEDVLPEQPSEIGETPLWLPPAFLGGRSFRFHLPGYSDSTLAGQQILAAAASRGTALVVLRRTAPLLPERVRGTPLLRRRWVQWGLVGLGAGLTGASALLKHEGDRWYDRYLESSDRRVLDTYFDRAVRYDRLSLVSLGLGQALFTGGLVLLVSGGPP